MFMEQKGLLGCYIRLTVGCMWIICELFTSCVCGLSVSYLLFVSVHRLSGGCLWVFCELSMDFRWLSVGYLLACCGLSVNSL